MKKLLPVLLLLLILSGGALYSYYSFVTFSPATISTQKRVMGASSKKQLLELPLPRDHKILSTDENTSRKVIIFESAHSTKNIQDFYKSVLLGKGWKIDVERQEGIFTVLEYKKTDDADVTVTASEQVATETTLVTINIRGNND